MPWLPAICRHYCVLEEVLVDWFEIIKWCHRSLDAHKLADAPVAG
jgi:hypothetical protein